MTKKKKSADKKAKTDSEKLAKEINEAVEPTIDLEDSEEDSAAASEEIDLVAELVFITNIRKFLVHIFNKMTNRKIKN